MRYFCVATDYDGTIAGNGIVSLSTIEALKHVRASGRKLILATGRQLGDLAHVFPEIGLFDRVVAENGAVLYHPATKEKRILSSPPPEGFVRKLEERGVPISVGEAILASSRPYDKELLELIGQLGLNLQITFNKDAVMVLPAGVTKGSGVKAALKDLKLSPHNAVGVGDAENDHAFLQICEFRVAVQNALPALKDVADFVTDEPAGAGVEQLIEKLLADDLAHFERQIKRHRILLGHTAEDDEFLLSPYGYRLVVAGPSGSGKSRFVTLLVERLSEKGYQACVIDPEGDYDGLKGFVSLGRRDHRPDTSEMIDLLETHYRSVTVNLLGLPVGDRPAFFQKVLPRIQELRSKTGRPHWLIIDEAHHFLPVSLDSANLVVPKQLANAALITVRPDHLSKAILSSVNGLVLVGPDPRSLIEQFNEGASGHLDPGSLKMDDRDQDGVLVWLFAGGGSPSRVKLEKTKVDWRRYQQKYALGELGADKSFYFTGPHKKMNLRAQNMNSFVQLAEGVDEETFTHHLRAHDYSNWVRDSVRDEELSGEIRAIEDAGLSGAESRQRLLDAVRRHYTAPV